MSDKSHRIPDQKELEKELSDYLSKKYGTHIRVMSPMMTSDDKPPKGKAGVEQIKFDLKPTELEAYLHDYVIKQDEAKAILATKICTHYNRIRYQNRNKRGGGQNMVGRIKNNIVLIGPTGVGKTYLIKLIAQKLGVPFVKGDATKFSETGYVGGDVEDLVRELVVQADDDIELAEHGIIYIDEIDKIASSTHFIGPDVSRTGVQRALLKPMEETDVDLKVAHDPISQLQAIEHFRKTGKKEKRVVNTRNILFIMSGAFNELGAIIKNRIQKQNIGFGAKVYSKEIDPQYLQECKAEDLIAYGFESEFIGRLPVIATLQVLQVEDLYQILKNPNNPIILGKKEDFRSYGIDIKFEDEALYLLAQMAYEEKTGARGLVSVIEKVLLPFEKTLPSTSVLFLVVTSDLVRAPQDELARILANPNDPQRQAAYESIVRAERNLIHTEIMRDKKYLIDNYPLVFNRERLELMINRHMNCAIPIDDLCNDILALHNQIRLFEAGFYDRHGFKIHFDEDATNEIIARSLHNDITASAVCKKVSRDYDYGFKLIADRSGQIEFTLPRKSVAQPDIYLEELIRESYHYKPDNPPETNPSD
ncbi:AAA family ATPase [Desulfoferrobacter suflitae]|uniref:AAA family ATPase n=1 Tax=Desulfoferrobacter suflitae TaxID=2865782 RepID=UPI0021648ABE|nr:AAA family ATPase [Desulfoferrobacter suflitae]MCK8603265.1 AAA family ATPase [Desulfoferrobacter suflitae]